MRAKKSDSAYVYPDLCVFCAKPLMEDNNTSLLNPILFDEVTSPSSRVRDRVDKLDYSQEVASNEAYHIVERDYLEPLQPLVLRDSTATPNRRRIIPADPAAPALIFYLEPAIPLGESG